MRKKASLALITAIAVSATTAMAEGSNWYAGLGVGQTKVSNWASNSDVEDVMVAAAMEAGLDDFDGTSHTSSDDSDTGWKVFAGYQFHPNFAAEMSYMDLGEVTANGSASGDFFCGGYCFTGSLDLKTKAEASAWTLDGIAKTDLAPWVGVFGKLGLYRAKVEQSVTVGATAGIDSASESLSNDDTSTGLHFGVGADFYVTSVVSIRAEWERLSKIEANDDESDVDLLSISAIYKF